MPTTKSRGAQVFEEGRQSGRTGDACDEARNAAVRTLPQEGQEPQTGDRDWPLRSSEGGRQSSEEEILAAQVLMCIFARPSPRQPAFCRP